MNNVKVKICGVTRLEDALAAQAAGADMIGFVFADSARKIAPDAAAAIAPRISCLKVGVFVNQPPDAVNRVARLCALDYVQLHGDETPAQCAAMTAPVIKAIRVRTAADLDAAAAFRVDRLLFDAYSPESRGGTGKRFDWNLLAGFGAPYILAGGLGPDNVAAAVARLSPWGVDGSSRLEIAPGVKDHAKIAAFIRAAKGL